MNEIKQFILENRQPLLMYVLAMMFLLNLVLPAVRRGVNQVGKDA